MSRETRSIQYFNRRFVFILILALMSTAASGQSGSAVGKVVFATGNTLAIDTSGSQRGLRRGDDVFAGDTLRTGGNSRLQASFVDGAYISVQPDSEYKIKEYEYSGQPDGSESAVYRLIKGGVRAVTGLIGKEKPEAYKVETAAATIGVRGTGHNTRICQGDCAGKQNGLYHHTWEGITYVFNNAESVDVPAGRGVYVRNMNTPIRFLAQPPGLTALDLRQRREEHRDEEDEKRLVAVGDRRNPDGRQSILFDDTEIVPISSSVLVDQRLTGVSPGSVDVISGSDTSVFTTGAGFAGFLTSERDRGTRTLETIDPGAMLGGDDADSAAEAETILSQADPAQVALFLESPAAAVESVINPVGLAWGRWSGGNVLTVDEDGSTSVKELINNQSAHFIFGPQPGTLPSQGLATYEFIGGTQSTSLSGDTIGEGVMIGSIIGVDFAISSAFIDMSVRHAGADYAVEGDLGIDRTGNRILTTPEGVFASTSLAGSACNPECPTNIDGMFTGPASNGFPGNIGIEYDIMETDIITGVAGFHFADSTGTNTVLSDLGLVSVVPSGGAFVAGNGGGGFGFIDGNDDFVGAIYSSSSTELRTLETIDVNAMLAGNNPAAVADVSGLLAQANQTQLNTFTSPASVVESGSDRGISWGRWANGQVLKTNVIGDTTVTNLSGGQSEHFIYGPEPTIIPETGGATYGMFGGTQSTSASGDVGPGVTNNVFSGALNVDFVTGMARLFMSLEHGGNNYEINSGFNEPNVRIIGSRITHINGDTDASTFSSPGSACDPSCPAFIEGRFFGPADQTGAPSGAGLEYEIQENDPISGTAVFSTAVDPPS